MNRRDAVEYALIGVFVLLAGSVLLGQLLGQPILLGYVETGSMSPTMEPGDGFVAVPKALSGDIGVGDVIVFDAQNLQGGGLTTHRVVGETEEGFITKGDANPVTDQDGNEPPVQRAQIVATALQVGGNVVVIPNLGLLVTGVQDVLTGVQRQLSIAFGTRALLGTQGLAYLLFAGGVLAYLASVYLESGEGRRRDRNASRDDDALDAHLVVLGLTLILVLVLTASMALTGGTQDYTFVSSQSDSPGLGVVHRGSVENATYTVPSNGLLPVVVFLETEGEGFTADPSQLYVPGGQSRDANLSIQAPPQTGVYPRFLTEHRFLALLPRSMIGALYSVHAWLPILVIDALVAVGFAGLGLALVGTDRVRIRSRDGPSLGTRIRRWLR